MRCKMLKKLILMIVLLPLLAFAAPVQTVLNASQQDQQVLFDRTAIQFVVPVGKQRMISFPDRITITNTDTALTNEIVSMFNNNGTLYVTAKKAFKPILLPVKLVTSGQVVLIYLSADAKAKNTSPLNVVVPEVSQSQYRGNETETEPSFTINAVSLLRFAAQQFSYKRLANIPDAISRTPLFSTRSVSIYYGDSVMAFPLASWKANDLYVSVVQVTNTTNKVLTLDPRYLMGYWQAAAFYRFDTVMSNHTTPKVPFNVLTPQGSARDYTLLLVVSNMPFGEAIKTIPPFNRNEMAG